ncbi:MAG: TonB-dependent receptor [Firmicutes bacterium]|nr:TonB-dependent receptor [Bacillota bacterium]
MMQTIFNKTPLALLCLSTFTTASVWAQTNTTPDATPDTDAIERITVTGEFRATGLEDVPASVSVLRAEDVRARQAEHLEDALAMAPNVNLAAGGSRANFFQIRGIGERSQFVDPINPSVGLVVDGINYSGLGHAGTLFDIGQVEVFRGPQSTRFGADAMAGMIYLSSTPLSPDNNGLAEVSWANYSSYAAGVAFGGALNDQFVARGSLYHYQSDGFIENTFLDRTDTNGQDELTLRLNGLWTLSPDLDVLLTYHRYDIDNGYDTWSLDLDRTTLSDTPGRDTLDSHAFRSQLNYRALQAADIEFAISYLTAEQEYSFDEDWAFEGIRPDWEYNSFDAYFRDRDDLTLELRALSDQPVMLGNLATDWVAGVYWRQSDMDLTRNYTYLAAPFSSQYETENWAVYGELIQQWTPQLRATYGLRVQGYDNDYRDSRNITANPSDTTWGGRASLQYQVNANEQFYASLSRGFKQGGVNGEALGRAGDRGLEEASEFLESVATFAPELLTNSELGYRLYLPEQSLGLNLTVFYSWREDMQVNAYVLRDQQFVTYLDNASSGRNYGVEAELDYVPRDDLRLFASLGVMQTELRDFELEGGVNISGREQAHAPNYQLHTGLEWNLQPNLMLRVELDARDGFYFSNTHDERASSYQLLHARLNYQLGDWMLSLWARNLTDEDYATRGFFFGNDPRDEYTPKNYVQYGEPRRFGVTARYSF